MQHRVPTPVPGVDVYKLPLSTLEGFVLSRVDGTASVEDISIMSGIDKDKVLSILTRLADLGAVELAWLGGRARRAATGTGRQPPVPLLRAPEPVAAPDAHFAPRMPRFDPSEHDRSVQIPIEGRRRILNAFLAIEGMDLYQVLGVKRSADKKVIRNAYFELSKVFHPDAYFGKELGSFKPKMEAVFKRLTEAYETLGKPKRRTEYDEYLASTEQIRRAHQTLESIELGQAEIEAHRAGTSVARPASESSEPAPRSTTLRVAMPPPSAPAAERQARASLRPQPTTAERRARVRDRLLQRMKVVSSTRRPPPSSDPASGSPSEPTDGGNRDQRRRSVIDGLKQSIRAAVVVTHTPNAQILSLMKKAREAEEARDVLLAASHLQLALSIEPSNAEIVREYDRVSKVVARNLAANYEKQAIYEEKTGNWKAAGRSWSRASDGRPEDPNAARRAAQAMLKASGDMHRAQAYAQRAVSLDGRSVENLTVLARVYLAAGLKLNALRELEKAAQLAPKDEMVNNLLREVR